MLGKRLPCIIDGIRYESINVAAKALKIDPARVRFRLRSSNFPNYTSKHHPKSKRKEITAPTPCTIKGVAYPSISDAARKLKTKHETISKRLRSSDYPDYVCADIPKKPPRPVEYRYKVKGKRYRSLQEIADMEGVTKEWIRQKINSPKYPRYRRI